MIALNGSFNRDVLSPSLCITCRDTTVQILWLTYVHQSLDHSAGVWIFTYTQGTCIHNTHRISHVYNTQCTNRHMHSSPNQKSLLSAHPSIIMPGMRFQRLNETDGMRLINNYPQLPKHAHDSKHHTHVYQEINTKKPNKISVLISLIILILKISP